MPIITRFQKTQKYTAREHVFPVLGEAHALHLTISVSISWQAKKRTTIIAAHATIMLPRK